MKILFIGGNGNISWYCVQEAISKGYEVYELNRGETLSTRRAIQPEVNKITLDIRDHSKVRHFMKDMNFDIVCDFICYNKEHADFNIEIFKGKVKQFIFISSEAVYERKSQNLPYKETASKYSFDTTCNYILDKLEAEQAFMNAYKEFGFPITIIRPAYTYDTIMPASIGHNCFTAQQLYIDGYPILIAGDGTNLWTFTHSKDFASAFIHLLNNNEAIGEDFNIANEEYLTWNEVMGIIAENLKIYNPQFIHIPRKEILQYNFLGETEMLFQKMWHNIYDISKIKKIAPTWKPKILFKDGIKETIKWFMQDSVRRRFNKQLDNGIKFLYNKYNKE